MIKNIAFGLKGVDVTVATFNVKDLKNENSPLNTAKFIADEDVDIIVFQEIQTSDEIVLKTELANLGVTMPHIVFNNDSFGDACDVCPFSAIHIDTDGDGWIDCTGNCSDLEKNRDEKKIDYGGACGTCYDKKLSEFLGETEVDYGGDKCGYCLDSPDKIQDGIWQIAREIIPEEQLIPFNKSDSCIQAENSFVVIFVTIIIIVIITIIIVLIIIALISFLPFLLGFWRSYRKVLIFIRFIGLGRKTQKRKKNKDIEQKK